MRQKQVRYYHPPLNKTKLVGGFNPFEKYYLKMGIFPNFRGEHKTYWKPPPRKHPSKFSPPTLIDAPLSILDEFTSTVFTVKTWRVGYHHGGTFKPKTQLLANKSTTIRIQPMVASYHQQHPYI